MVSMVTTNRRETGVLVPTFMRANASDPFGVTAQTRWVPGRVLGADHQSPEPESDWFWRFWLD